MMNAKTLSLLEQWAPVHKTSQLSEKEKSVLEHAGRAIAANTLERDIPVLISISHGGVPENIAETQMANYIQGVFDMAASSMKDFPHGRTHLPLIATEFALASLKNGAVEPNHQTFNYHGPRLRNPGSDWLRT